MSKLLTSGVNPDLQTKKDIYEYDLHRLRLQQVCSALRSLIFADPIFWMALYIDRVDPSGQVKSQIPVNKNLVPEHFKMVKTRSINIHFALPCTGKHTSLADTIWTQMLKQQASWRTLLLSANNMCRENERCLQSMLQGDFLGSASRIVKLAASKKEGEYPGCGMLHDMIKIALAKEMRSIGVQAPASITSWRDNNLRLLDIRTEENNTRNWSKFFDSCVRLEDFTWRRRAPMRATRIVTLPNLRSFTTYTTNFMPPIAAPNLSSLTVLDSAYAFTSNQFDDLVGAGLTTPHMRSLDLLVNPTRNMDVEDLFRRCPNLETFRVSTHDTRTALYGAVAARGRLQFLLFGARTLEEVKFAHGPPTNTQAEAARRRYEGLRRMAFKVESNKFLFEPRAARLVVSRFPADFTFGDEDQAELIEENGMDVEKTRVYDQGFNPMRLTSTSEAYMVLIVLSTDATGTNAVLTRGWYYNGRRYNVFRDRPGRA
ncbi:hypothetical protein R3P38DRAFT_2796512 [Favolaschia claudopus]|uniref:Uncharacterized protein n=1 Tax=Favolaschia claudopus TaxID=2862362 RepID=A0AAW0A532_9AGAR